MNEQLPQPQVSLPPVLSGLTIEISVRVGTSEVTLEELTQLTQGSVVTLKESAERPLDLCANGRVIARGELEETEDGTGLALRITETCGTGL
ncbi:MAG: FliM/FliN family flagellar motor switch protein [Pseudomonadota bacterium]